MATTTPPRSRTLSLLHVLALLGLGSAGCGSGGNTPPADMGTDSSDGEDMGTDQGPVDMGRDLGMPMCEGVVCDQPFFYCSNGACVEYARCFTSATCPQGSTCTGLHCVPGDVDVDGDGYPGATDCDEANPAVNPGAAEVCGLADENCSGTADEGDPIALCAGDPADDVCMSSICCAAGTYNFDGDPGTACECATTPALGAGGSCGGAIGLAPVPDAGGAAQTMTVTDNALPAGREVWYRFSATDSPDASCDNFHVRVRFLENPGNRYRFNVFRGCGTALCDGNAGYTDTNWALDTNTGGRQGQCPCGPNSGTLNTCANDTQDFMIRVRWEDTSAPDCQPYVLEITNGIF
jgi:hypothetical protein